MGDFWQTLTDPQATIISGLLTIAAAVIGVVLGSKLFGGRVSDLEAALEISKERIDEHLGEVDAALKGLESKISQVDSNFKPIYEKLGRVEQTIDDQEAAKPSLEGDVQQDAMANLKSFWRYISNKIEEIAASEEDGRRRGKYARVDRRQFSDLIDKSDQDRKLGRDGRNYREAFSLWQQYRNGRRQPPEDVLQRMRQLKSDLVDS
jgi:chromosome segregation ATPase